MTTNAGFAIDEPTTRELTGGDLLAQSLKACGVEVAFGLHGGHLDAFLMGCENNGIRLVDTRHETVAVQAAEAYTKMTAKIGVCFVTANSGSVTITYIDRPYIDSEIIASPMDCLVSQQRWQTATPSFALPPRRPFVMAKTTPSRESLIKSLQQGL